MGKPQEKDPLDIRDIPGLRRVQPKPPAIGNDEDAQASADAMKAQHAANAAAVEQTTPPAAPAQSQEPAMSEPKIKTTPEVIPIAKPSGFSLDKFKSKRAAALANVETLQTGLPHHKMSAAKDFTRLHPDEDAYWTQELCFVNVPIQGQKKDTLHLIDEDLAVEYLPSGRIQHFRLALASKPNGALFLCEVPSRNLDNQWNSTNMEGCEKAKIVMDASLQPEGGGGRIV